MKKYHQKSLTDLQALTVSNTALKTIKGGNDQSTDNDDYIVIQDVVNG